MDFTPNTGLQIIARIKMGTRKHQAPRCPTCFTLEALCICAEARELKNRMGPLNTSIHVIMHHREQKSTTNTSRLMALVHPNCFITLRGQKSETPTTLSESPDPIHFSPTQSFFLFPDKNAIELSPQNISKTFSNTKSLTMIVPDGSWRQASKIYKREPALHKIPIFKLAEPLPVSKYFLRREPRPDGFATFEAMAHALGILESQNTKELLLNFFDSYVQRTLNSRKGIFLS